MPKTIRAITPQPEESPVTMEKKSIRAPQVGMIGIDRWTDNPVIDPYKSILPIDLPASGIKRVPANEYKSILPNDLPATSLPNDLPAMSIKRVSSIPKEQLMGAIQRKLGSKLQGVTDYNYNTEMPNVPSSRDKMYEMAIARRSSNGARLPSPKFSIGGLNGI